MYVDFRYAFQCSVFVVQLCLGAKCDKVVQTFEWRKSLFGKVWEFFGSQMGAQFGFFLEKFGFFKKNGWLFW